MTYLPDVRRRVALRAYGPLRFLDSVQGELEDVEGAIGAHQYGVAASQARLTVLACLSIQSLAREGEIEFDEGSSVSLDFFAGLSPDEVAAALSLANEALDVDERTSADWLERFRAYVAETEGILGYDNALPTFRSPEGAFGMISLTRRWVSILEDLGLPALLPSDWASDDTAQS
jgi:hypothetical protein